MVSQPPPTEVGLVFESLEASSRVAQLEASSGTLWPRRQQIGVATGLVAQRLAHHPERAWSLLVRVSQSGHVKVATSLRPSSTRTAVDSAQQRSKYSA